MTQKQWFELDKNCQQIADDWWQFVYQPYLDRVNNIVRHTFKADSYFTSHNADGSMQITGIYFQRPPLKYWKEVGCKTYLPSRRNKRGKELDEKLQTILRSPILFEPLREKLQLPVMWELKDSSQWAFPTFEYFPNGGIFTAIPVEYAIAFNEKPEVTPILALSLERIRQQAEAKELKQHSQIEAIAK